MKNMVIQAYQGVNKGIKKRNLGKESKTGGNGKRNLYFHNQAKSTLLCLSRALALSARLRRRLFA